MNRSHLAASLLVLLVVACKKAPEPAATPPAPSAAQAPVPSASSAANGPFEGEIVVTVKDEASKKLPPSIIYSVKGNKVRYLAADTPLRAIGDLDAQKVYAIDDTLKSVDTMDVKAAADAKPVQGPKVQKVGKTEKVAGLDCEDWTIDDGNEKVDVCASKGIAFFDLASGAKPGSTEAAWAMPLTSEKAFPLRVVVHDKSGKEEYRAEATKADRKRLDDSIFQAPSGYKQADLTKETRTASLP